MASFLLLQTLAYKFSGSEESVYIFTKVGMEPWGRIGSGVVELIAGILLMIPKWRVFGALTAILIISGAIFFHLTLLGIEVNNDHGLLFFYALTVFISCFLILRIRQDEFPVIPRKSGR